MSTKRNTIIFSIILSSNIFFCGCGIIFKKDGPVKEPEEPSINVFYGRISQVYNPNNDVNVDSVEVKVFWGVNEGTEIKGDLYCFKTKKDDGDIWFFCDDWYDKKKYSGKSGKFIIEKGEYYQFHFENPEGKTVKHPEHGSEICITWKISR